MILTDIGEIGVHSGGRELILRPSFYAMSQIGTPAEIVHIFKSVFAPVLPGHERRVFMDALTVLTACCSADDIDDAQELFGYWGESGFVAGSAPVEHVLLLARHLLRHGIIGALPPAEEEGAEPAEYAGEFRARDHAAMAVAHLGASERDAWAMTMTSFLGAMRAKFPRPQREGAGAKAPTLKEHEATMAWFERVEAKRKKKLEGR